MSIVYGMKLACDAYYLYCLIGLIGFMYNTPPGFVLMPFLMAIGGGIGYFLYRKTAKEAVRYIPLALGLVPLFWCASAGQALLFLPGVGFGIMYIKNNRRLVDYYYAYTKFLQGLIPLVVVLILSIGMVHGAWKIMLPYIFMHLALGFTLLRMLRHDDKTLSQKRFLAINLLSLAGMGAAGLLLSTDLVIRALKFLGNCLNDYVLNPILKGLGWLVEGFFYVLTSILRALQLYDFLEGEVADIDYGSISMGEKIEEMRPVSEEVAANPIVRKVVIALGILALCYIAFRIVRALARQKGRDAAIQRKEQREKIDDVQKDEDFGIAAAIRRRSDPVLAVRHAYRKFLRMAEGREVRLNGRQNSLQIRDLSKEVFEENALDDLRRVYIRARYDQDASPEDVHAAKDAYDRLKSRKKQAGSVNG